VLVEVKAEVNGSMQGINKWLSNITQVVTLEVLLPEFLPAPTSVTDFNEF